MDLARERARAGAAAGTTVVARQQTAGRGRFGAWQSEPGDGLYFTCVTWPRPVWPAASLSPTAALAIALWCRARGAAAAQVKWPNDVLGAHGKLCGVLLEQGPGPTGAPFVLIGVGVNLRRPTLVGAAAAGDALPASGLHDEVAQAGSLPLAAPAGLLMSLLAALGEAYERWQERGLAPSCAAYDAAHAYFGRDVAAEGAGPRGETVRGEVGSIDASGALLLRAATGSLRLISARLRLAEQSPSAGPVR